MSAWLERTDRMISAQLATYRHQLGGGTRQLHGSGAVKCPRCGLVLASRLPSLEPRHCPRCLARRRIAVSLERFSGSLERDPLAGVTPAPGSQ